MDEPREMRAEDVVEILRLLADAGVVGWVDGGWGVEALLGEISREHADLDLVVRADEIGLVRAVLARAGFRQELRDWLPTALALADSGGREVDLHPVSPTPDGGGDQRLPNGDTFHYPSPVRGSVGGREVWCVNVDMDRLRDRFGITLPDTYA